MLISKKEKREYRQLESKTSEKYSLSSILFNDGDFFVYQEIIEPGHNASAPHTHQDTDELIYVLDGEIEVIEGDEVITLRSGDSAIFQKNSSAKHYFSNKLDLKSEVLVLTRKLESKDTVY